MNEFKQPMRTIYKQFTRSEIAIMSWSSQEQIADLEKHKPAGVTDQNTNFEANTKSKYINEDGEVDVSKMTGRQAVNYFGKMGIHFMPIVK